MWSAVWIALLCVGCDRIFGLDDAHQPDIDARPQLDASDPTLIARYAMDEVTDDKVIDTIGNHTAVCSANSCPTPTAGHSSGEMALAFDGSTQYLTIAYATDLDFNAHPYTVAAWIRVDVLPVDEACFFNQTYEDGGNNAWQLCVDSGAVPQFFSASGTGFNLLQDTEDVVPTGSWHHVAIVHSLTDKNLYYDGHVIATATVGAPVQDPSFTTYLGADVDNGTTVTAAAAGAIDELRVYSRDLSATEVLALYGMSP